MQSQQPGETPNTILMTARSMVVALGGFWLILAWHLAPLWSADPQYHFGWLILPAGPFLLWRRWLTRPDPESGNRLPAILIAALAAMAFLPTWLVAQPNPDWRLVNWALGIEVVVITLCAIHLAGGRSWLRHFSIPVCLVLATIPWPSAIEIFVVQISARAVAATSVEALNLMGIAALARGNLIELTTGVVGIDDACSGIRSLQATVMATLFIGELFRLRFPWRAGLFAAGLVTAFVCNLIRAFILAWIASRDGSAGVEKWHDPAGFTILAISFFLTWRIALWSPHTRLAATRHAAIPTPLPKAFSAGLAVWLCAALLITETWYRSHQSEPSITWSPKWPESAAQFERKPIPPHITSLLHYDHSEFAQWMSPEGDAWIAYYFRWDPGPVRSRQIVRNHKPDVCLPAVGCRLLTGPRPVRIEARDITIPFNAYTFIQDQQHKLHVFHCVWQDHSETMETSSTDGWSRMEALRPVLAGQRNIGQQMLELIIYSEAPADVVEQRVRALLPNMIQR